MKKNTGSEWLLFLIGVPVSIAMVYLMALAGEPRSAWMMCEILNLCEAGL